MLKSKTKPPNLELCVQQKSFKNEKEKLPQTKNIENVLPADLLYKKC